MLRVPFDDLQNALYRALLPLGFADERAALCARLIAETDRDGISTHGLARFPRFVAMCRSGVVDVDGSPSCMSSFGALERWDGHGGPGNLNAHAAMARACELAKEHGLGAVFLARTNHWMRGGTYGWQAAEEGCFAMCWTNTLANLPAWGTAVPSLGNNPLVMAAPRANGAHVVLDMAMSQYSYGTLSAYAARGEALPYAGGFDDDGDLTTDAAAIAGNERALPIGLWKGSGLSMMLDLFAAMLSEGNAVHAIARDPLRETGLSQFFLAIDPGRPRGVSVSAIADGVLQSLPEGARYPGERTLEVRKKNMQAGVPVDEDIWQRLLAGAV